jgi:hypothetical protein
LGEVGGLRDDSVSVCQEIEGSAALCLEFQFRL